MPGGKGFSVEMRLQGARRVVRALEAVPKQLRRRTLVTALSAAGGVLKRAAKRRAPKRTGLLRRSLRVHRVNVSRAKDVIAYRVGPKSMKRLVSQKRGGGLSVAGRRTQETVEFFARRFGGRNVGQVKTRKRILKKRYRYVNPANYAHLVELGHQVRQRRGGRVVGHADPEHFLKRAYDARKRVAFGQIMRKIRQAIQRHRGSGLTPRGR